MNRHGFCLFSGCVTAWATNDSHISHLIPNALGILLIRTMGVSPIRCRMFGRMVGEAALEAKGRDVKKKKHSDRAERTWCLHVSACLTRSSESEYPLDYLMLAEFHLNVLWGRPVLTWRHASGGSRFWRLPDSTCSGWGGLAGSTSFPPLGSLSWAEWLSWGLRCSPKGSRWAWRLRWRGHAAWQSEGSLWRRPPWARGQTALLILKENRKTVKWWLLYLKDKNPLIRTSGELCCVNKKNPEGIHQCFHFFRTHSFTKSRWSSTMFTTIRCNAGIYLNLDICFYFWLSVIWKIKLFLHFPIKQARISCNAVCGSQV